MTVYAVSIEASGFHFLLLFQQEENDVGEFFITLEKDPQQEDFLQGRMLGNPYSSNEPGLGPLMRDVKNKICQGMDVFIIVIEHVSECSLCSLLNVWRSFSRKSISQANDLDLNDIKKICHSEDKICQSEDEI